MTSEPKIPSVGHFRPNTIRLLHIWTAAAWMDSTPDKVVAMIEDGQICWAFDISLRGGRRREMRVLAQSVFDYLDHTKPVRESAKAEWERVSDSIIPKTRIAVPTAELSQAWSCVPDHVMGLVRKKCISLVPGSPCHPGPKGAAKIDRASALAFLLDRRVF